MFFPFFAVLMYLIDISRAILPEPATQNLSGPEYGSILDDT